MQMRFKTQKRYTVKKTIMGKKPKKRKKGIKVIIVLIYR